MNNSLTQRNLIRETLVQKTNDGSLSSLFKEKIFGTLKSLSEGICKTFNFFSTDNKPQTNATMKALRSLESAGKVTLPDYVDLKADRKRSAPATSVDLIPTPVIHGDLEKINFNLQLIKTEEEQKIFNTIVEKHATSKSNRLAGMQLSYLVKSEESILGCVSFSSPVFRSRARENWIGWSDEERNLYLNYIIRLSHLELLPSVSNTALKSRILKASIEALKEDFKAKYGFEISIIEAYLNPEKEDINAYINANWIEIGLSSCKKEGCIKKVLIFKLNNDLKSKFIDTEKRIENEKNNIDITPLDYTNYDFDKWSETEFEGCDLGHASRTKRLIKIAKQFAKAPGKSIDQTSDKTCDEKGAYRFFENDNFSYEDILSCHYKQSVRRILSEKVVLAISDGTKLNYDNIPTCVGLGDIGTNQTKSITKGMQLHTTQLYTESGVPLGLVQAVIEARKFKENDENKEKEQKKDDENKLWVWLEGNKVLEKISEQAPNTKIIHICDREADFYELFESAHESGLSIIVRAAHDRKICDKNKSLFEALEEDPKQGSIKVLIKRASTRPKKSGQEEKIGRSERKAKLEISFGRYTFKSTNGNGKTVTLNAVYASEINCPLNQEPVEWYILTNLEVKTFADAITVIKYYIKRWRIEEYHRILKSGCEVEKVQFKDAERIKRLIAIKLVIAWRIMLMLSLGRECPNLPPETVFTEREITFLRSYAIKNKKRTLKTVGDAVVLVSCMGGYLDRKSDDHPGFQVFWSGYEKLQVALWGAVINNYYLLNET